MSDRLKRIKYNQDIDGIIASTFDAGWLIKVAEAMTKIADYKKRTDHEDDYQSLISIIAIAQDVINPMEIV